MHSLWSESTPNGFHWAKRAGVLALVFLLTIAAVYLVAVARRRQSISFSATAVVSVPKSALRSSGPQEDVVPDALIREVIAEWGPAAEPPGPGSIAKVRRNLRMVTTGGEEPERVRVALTYTAATAEEALQVTNRLGKHLADRHCSAQAAWSHERRRRGRAATENAWLELQRAESELREYVQQQFEQWRQRVGRLENLVESTTSTPEPVAPTVPKVREMENPAWTELNRQVTELKEERAELLDSRTALHPAVRDLDTDIARLERTLAGIPRYIAKRPEIAEATPGPQPDRESDGGAHFNQATQPALQGIRNLARLGRVAAEGFAAKSIAVDEARRKYEQFAAAERRARDNPSIPPARLELAERCSATRGPANGRLAFVALAAGLAMAIGVGLTWNGAAAELTLSGASDVEAVLAIPVVGAVSVDESFRRSPDPPPIPSAGSMLMLVSGMALMVACLGVLVLAACLGIGF